MKAKNLGGWTSLAEAISYGDRQTSKYIVILTQGAPVKVKNLGGWTPLTETISYGDRLTSKYSTL